MTDTRRFYAVEVAHAPNSGGATAVWGQGGVAGETLLRASDLGYRSEHVPSRVYPPTMIDALSIDRRLNLSPSQSAAAAAWGKIRLGNTDQRYDVTAATRNCAGRDITILTGMKTRDVARGVWLDPTYGTLTKLFQGVTLPWSLSETSLDIGLRDATHWLEKPLQRKQYAGTGGLEGPAELAGVCKPITRGGWSGFPIFNVTPVLVDPLNRIYQYSDAAGAIANLYEGGAAVITFQANVADLYVGSTTAGQYRTDNARALFQLGSSPVRPITCDVRGSFPIAGNLDDPYSIAKALLLEDCALPPAYLYAPSFVPVGAVTAMQSGIYFDTTEITGAEAVGRLISSAYAVLYPRRDGTLALCQLNGLGAADPTTTWTDVHIVKVVPRELPPELATPTYRWRWGYKHNYTVQTSDLNPTITDARRAFLAVPDTFFTYTNALVVNNYKTPTDPPAQPSALLSVADATVMATIMQTTWGKANSRLYDVTVPIEIGFPVEIGQYVRIFYPLDVLDDTPGGTYCLVVGEQFRAGEGFTTFQVVI